MPRLIDADALNDTVEKSIAKFGEVFSEDLITGLRVCVYIAMQQPTQPEIIHCRNCRYWEREKPFATSGRCFIWECTERKGSDYCSEARKVSE